MAFTRRVFLLPLLIGIAASFGCGKGEATNAERKAVTQVAAKVNSDEITVSQINNVLSGVPNIAPEAADRVKRDILNRLIDQQLARQQAIEKKLDRSPRVMQAIEAARTEILARAYGEQIAAAQAKPTPDEIKKYYAEHPELFSQRRLFDIEKIGFVARQGVTDGLRERLAKVRSMQEIATWLKSQGVQFDANREVRAAEQIPLDVVPKLQAMKDGEIRLFENAGGGQIIRLAASKANPVTEQMATPRIEQYLFNRRSSEAVAAEMKRIKAGAKIEYVGEFAGGAAAAEAKAKAEAEAKAKARAAEKAKSEAETQARADELSKAIKAAEDKARLEAEARERVAATQPVQVPQQNIERGIGGLR